MQRLTRALRTNGTGTISLTCAMLALIVPNGALEVSSWFRLMARLTVETLLLCSASDTIFVQILFCFKSITLRLSTLQQTINMQEIHEMLLYSILSIKQSMYKLCEACKV